MGLRSSKQKADITTPTKDKAKVKRKKSKKDKDVINGSTGVEEVSIQEKKDDAETIQVADTSKAQEAEASKKGETDSTGSGNAPTEIVEDSPDKEHQKVAQLSDVQSPSEPSTSPVEQKELANETVAESTQQTCTETKVTPEVHSPQDTTTVSVEQEVKEEVKLDTPALATEVKTEILEPKAPEPVTEKKIDVSVSKDEVKAEVFEPAVEVKAQNAEPVVEVKPEVPEPPSEVKIETAEPVTEVPEPVAEKSNVSESTDEVKTEISESTAEVQTVVPEPVTEVKTEAIVEVVKEEKPEPVTETKVEAEEKIVTEPVLEEKALPEPVSEQNVETKSESSEQVDESVQNLESPVVMPSAVSEKPVETVELEKVPSEVESESVPVENPPSSNSQQVEETQQIESTETKSEVVSDVSDAKDNQSPIQETVSDTVSEESGQNVSMPEEVVSPKEEIKPEVIPEHVAGNLNSDLGDKSNLNSCAIQKEVEANQQSPVDDVHPVENERLNGHAEEHQVNGIEIQNGTMQETNALVNGEVIGNGPTETATLISWKHGGQEVAVCGDFCGWGDNCTLVETEGVFSTKIKLAKGQHHIKFFVDGQWTVDESAPVVELEGHGQVNLLVVTEGSE